MDKNRFYPNVKKYGIYSRTKTKKQLEKQHDNCSINYATCWMHNKIRSQFSKYWQKFVIPYSEISQSLFIWLCLLLISVRPVLDKTRFLSHYFHLESKVQTSTHLSPDICMYSTQSEEYSTCHRKIFSSSDYWRSFVIGRPNGILCETQWECSGHSFHLII